MSIMKLVTLLPADKYIVINKTILSDQDRITINNLYAPIIGASAVGFDNGLLRLACEDPCSHDDDNSGQDIRQVCDDGSSDVGQHFDVEDVQTGNDEEHIDNDFNDDADQGGHQDSGLALVVLRHDASGLVIDTASDQYVDEQAADESCKEYADHDHDNSAEDPRDVIDERGEHCLRGHGDGFNIEDIQCRDDKDDQDDHIYDLTDDAGKRSRFGVLGVGAVLLLKAVELGLGQDQGQELTGKLRKEISEDDQQDGCDDIRDINHELGGHLSDR